MMDKIRKAIRQNFAGKVGQLGLLQSVSGAAAKPAAPAAPAAPAGSSIPGSDPAQMGNMAGLSYGLMQSMMSRLQDPSMIGRNPMFTSNAYTRPVLSSGMYPSPPITPFTGGIPAGFDPAEAWKNLQPVPVPQAPAPSIPVAFPGLLQSAKERGGSPSNDSPSGNLGFQGLGYFGGGINPSWPGIGPTFNAPLPSLGPLDLWGGSGSSGYGNTRGGEGSSAPGVGRR